jgi:hypothetical protein
MASLWAASAVIGVALSEMPPGVSVATAGLAIESASFVGWACKAVGGVESASFVDWACKAVGGVWAIWDPVRSMIVAVAACSVVASLASRAASAAGAETNPWSMAGCSGG